MSFVFPVLLGGMVLIGIPVLIHLIMRQKPKVLPFPAFRFLVQRHRTNLRKLRLRHLLLLALRMLLIAAICLALARPKFFHAGLSLESDRPVAAILLIDTSFSMQYKTSDGLSRLDEAKRRAVELLDQLPEGSKVAILDTGQDLATRGEWLVTKELARERIEGLKPWPANAPVTARLEDAFRLFADLARTEAEDPAKLLPRFLCVFSDRTRGSWDASQLPRLYEVGDQVPPALTGLQQLRDSIPALSDSLRELRQKLPPPTGQDYPEQALSDALGQLRDHIPSVTKEDLTTDRELKKLLADVRRPGRQLLTTLQKMAAPEQTPAKEYRLKLVDALQIALAHLNGAYAVFVDVGVDRPVDLAIVDLELPRNEYDQPRQVFASDQKFLVRVLVQATGQDYNSKLACQVGPSKSNKAMDQAVLLKAGERQTFPFEIDCQQLKLGPGLHQLEVRLETPDLLAFNNSRYVTFAIREPRRVLVIGDDAKKLVLVPNNSDQSNKFLYALWSNRFAPEATTTAAFAKKMTADDLGRFQAIYLFEAARPDAGLWEKLEEFVKKGGGLGIIPGADEVRMETYNQGPAQKLMPGQLQRIKVDPGKGVLWDLGRDSIFQHPLLRPFRMWKDNPKIDFGKSPRKTTSYWEVQPHKDAGSVLVNYSDDKNRPALVERLFDQGERRGRVLLFTTSMDPDRAPRWNDYAENSFYIVITGLATRYLAGDTEEPTLNFLSGQTVPKVRLPLAPRFPDYSLVGPNIVQPVNVGEQQSDLTLKQAVHPGNYTVLGVTRENRSGQPVAGFSVNLPPEESDLSRVPPAEIEALLGPDTVVPVERRANIRELLQGHWDQPIELLPFLLILLLLVLAVENLLANKFYKKEPEDDRLAVS